jgi:Barstar (barnase inhibitor)
MRLVKLDTRRIADWNTFHDVFAETFGFPDFYGRNIDAWIDCMTHLDDPSAGMSNIHATPQGFVVLELEHVDDFIHRCPNQYEAIVESVAFVNWRRIERGYPAVLALSFYRNS